MGKKIKIRLPKMCDLNCVHLGVCKREKKLFSKLVSKLSELLLIISLQLFFSLLSKSAYWLRELSLSFSSPSEFKKLGEWKLNLRFFRIHFSRIYYTRISQLSVYDLFNGNVFRDVTLLKRHCGGKLISKCKIIVIFEFWVQSHS